MTPIQATHPLQFVTMDYLTIGKVIGFENILVIIDHFTKLTQAYPAKNQKAVTTAQLVLDFIRRYSKKYHSGQKFVGKVICSISGFFLKLSTTTMAEMLRKVPKCM